VAVNHDGGQRAAGMTEWRSLPLSQRALADDNLPTRGMFKLGDDLTLHDQIRQIHSTPARK